MFTVALIGADGAGKTSVARELTHTLDLPVRSLYMGVNPQASRLLLPTTRLALGLKRLAIPRREAAPASAGRRGASESRAAARRPLPQRALRALRSGLRTANWIAEQGLREAVGWSYRRRGCIVVCDRHFLFDYYTHAVARTDPSRPLASRVHRFFLTKVYPRPRLAVLLDAPAQLLHDRKPEHSVEFLEARRREYLEARAAVDRFEVVDATQPLAAVVEAVAAVIRDTDRAHGGRQRHG